MRAAIYARVSKDDGSQTTTNQLLELRRFAASQGWELVNEYCDNASGAKTDREQFQVMLRDAAMRRFDLLLVFAVDRISREGAAVVFATLSKLTASGVKFHSFSEPHLSTVGPFGDVVLAMYATFAKLERDKLIERTKAGLKRAVAEGKSLGRPRVSVNAAELSAMRSRGMSWSQIVKATGVSMGTAQRAVAAYPQTPTKFASSLYAESAA